MTLKKKHDFSFPPLVGDTPSSSAHTPTVEHVQISEYAPLEPEGPHEPPPILPITTGTIKQEEEEEKKGKFVHAGG